VTVHTHLADRRSRILSDLRAEVSRLLGIPGRELGVDRPLTACGLDSLSAIEIKTRIEERFGGTTSLAQLLEGATLGDLAEAILAAPAAPEDAGGAAPAEAGGVPEQEHPLSCGQSALWYLHRLAPGSPVYNVVGAAAVGEELDVPALERALSALAERHPALSSTIRETPKGPRQRPCAGRPPTLTREEGTGEGTKRLPDRLAAAAYRPFDLARGPLLRLHLFHPTPGERVLLLAAHHIAVDFWSLALLVRELGALYAWESAG
jgi:aryl carrier-like protein